MKFFYVFLLLSKVTFASPEIALTMVPKGTLSDTFGRDYKIKTAAGTKIEIEFKRNGKLEEAKGHNLNRGDHFEPGEGLLSLATVAQKIGLLGARPEGQWLLEEDEEHGWIYEVGTTLIDAKSGQLIKKSNEIGFHEKLSH
jgi:hypothetical protein